MLAVGGGLILLAVLCGFFLGLLRNRKAGAAEGLAVAHSERLRSLPGFGSAIRRYRLGVGGVLVVGILAVMMASYVAARPSASSTVKPVNTNRDIVLCLDVSGSMTEVDTEVADTFLKLVKGFSGERISLVLFNSSPVQVFPLTDDYHFVTEQLTRVRDSFDGNYDDFDYWVGTSNGRGASLIGDGLAACAMRFDHLDKERSRSVIFATDNEVYGDSIVELKEAAEYAKAQGVKVYGLNPIDNDDDPKSVAFREAVELTGGKYFPLRSTTAVSDIVDTITAEEATSLTGEARVVWADDPNLGILFLSLTGIAFIVLLWRVRL
ncbi:VWA domain-containing protein [Klugiella xanthotipulae]|uniref:von Willebrand factor type A domain-containing protein n=2 Tax=Klugiella xanthotipulae TaxID=244735 RepID=A0A543I4X4_9MICO|nr:von Willebrand factor type A domain-containing protein [Klugiella xanthotipulae]